MNEVSKTNIVDKFRGLPLIHYHGWIWISGLITGIILTGAVWLGYAYQTEILNFLDKIWNMVKP